MSFEKNWPRIELKQAEARVDKLYKNYRIMRRQEDKGINEELSPTGETGRVASMTLDCAVDHQEGGKRLEQT